MVALDEALTQIDDVGFTCQIDKYNIRCTVQFDNKRLSLSNPTCSSAPGISCFTF